MSEMAERMNAVLLKGKLNDPAFAFGDDTAERWWTEHHSAALQAALDSEDEALVAIIAAAIGKAYAAENIDELYDCEGQDCARAAIAALRKAAGQEPNT